MQKRLNAARERTAEVRRKQHELMKSDRTASKMWTEVKNNSNSVTSNSSEMVDPDLTWQLLQQRNGSTAAATRPSCTEDSLTGTSGIIPGTGSFSSTGCKAGMIAATVFITFLLALYAVLWKCMVSPPQRKHSKVRVRVQQRTSV